MLVGSWNVQPLVVPRGRIQSPILFCRGALQSNLTASFVVPLSPSTHYFSLCPFQFFNVRFFPPHSILDRASTRTAPSHRTQPFFRLSLSNHFDSFNKIADFSPSACVKSSTSKLARYAIRFLQFFSIGLTTVALQCGNQIGTLVLNTRDSNLMFHSHP
jgi:hypothetical protein